MTGELEGALVEVFQYEELVESGTTDVNGEYQVTLPVGTYWVRVSKSPGYRTHTYILDFVVVKECRVLNLPINPIWISSIRIEDNDMSEGARATIATTVNSTMALEAAATITPAVPTFNVSVSAAAVKSPTTWRLIMMPPCSTDGGQNDLIPNDAISPAVGNIDKATGQTISYIATSKQFLLYWYSLLDGAQVNSNGNVRELTSTGHNYTVATQTLGTQHTMLALFRKAWQCVVSVSGDGTTNMTGTWEVLEGQTGPTPAATPNGVHIFLWWTFDGKIVSLTNYTPPAQDPCTTHHLVAHFL